MRAPHPPPGVLKALGIDESARLGEGGEAWVYALDADRVARIHREGAQARDLLGRKALLDEMAAGAEGVSWAIPRVLEVRRIEDSEVAIETRLPGESLQAVLARMPASPERDALIERYLDAVSEIGSLGVAREGFGELGQRDPLRFDRWRDYLEASARRSLERAGPEFAAIDPASLAAALPDATEGALVHLDAFPGNMLSDGERVTAVIDFGTVTLIGDPRLDQLTAALYLQAPMTPEATARDRDVARAWLEARDLAHHLDAAERWVAAFWSFAHDDGTLFAWCRRTLLGR